jgi:transcriptional regulator GlxA family with amidase domain
MRFLADENVSRVVIERLRAIGFDVIAIGETTSGAADKDILATADDRTAMSPRNFARAFAAETRTTPAKAVDRLRLETARTAVEENRAPLERIAEAADFGDPGRMRRAFLRSFGQPPQALRRAARA